MGVLKISQPKIANTRAVLGTVNVSTDNLCRDRYLGSLQVLWGVGSNFGTLNVSILEIAPGAIFSLAEPLNIAQVEGDDLGRVCRYSKSRSNFQHLLTVYLLSLFFNELVKTLHMFLKVSF